jgi:hypothetical protein
MTGPRRPGLARFARVRRSSVAPVMIAAATAAREAGDWRAACAAARVDVDVDLVAVRREHGATAADALDEELAHLAPDLLRWHLPRVPESLALTPWETAVLTPAHRKAPHLLVAPPAYVSVPQRLTLRVVDRETLAGESYFDAPRHLWDVRRATDLKQAWGGSADRPPLLDPSGTPLPDERLGTDPDRAGQTERILALIGSGRHRKAWRSAGIELEPAASGPPYVVLERASIWPVGLAGEARRLAEMYRIRELNVAVPYRARFAVAVADDGSVTARLAESVTVKGQPHIAAPVCQAPVDLELLRAGVITPDDLHPLVRASLFPRLDPPSHLAPVLTETPWVRVRCRGAWHGVQVIDGRITALDHDPAEERREAVVRALGGASSGCFAVTRTWTEAGGGRLPRLLRSHRTEIYEHAFHGDTAFVVAMLDAGRLDPHMRDGHGRTLLHMLAHLDHEPLLPRLLARGVRVDARDHDGRTALFLAVVYHGSTALIRALRDAGADPGAIDNDGRTVGDWVRITNRPYLMSILEDGG